ncbi:hypothetical protein IWQ60_000994 [Tieghemiomyces parasiticus]|uniref:RING-type domain-containing protein n=1 Tax=Tieghemiomyces parasiticus TaxID=78921 RepID=A0A9W8ADU3_9FUNG|nr:hypothetical protein IWQ60_000994 [Tieghemiomyces parasiticus]
MNVNAVAFVPKATKHKPPSGTPIIPNPESSPAQHGHCPPSSQPAPSRGAAATALPVNGARTASTCDTTVKGAADTLGNGQPAANKTKGGRTAAAARQAQSLNHLLNFSFPTRQPPVSNAELRHRNRRTKVRTIQEPYRKERFINANYRFLLDPHGDYAVQFMDPDVALNWGDIQQVLVSSHQPLTCPICLEPPVAPRVTKCGHVYCMPCILRYLSPFTAIAGDDAPGSGGARRSWKKCPICWDPIYRRDLKCVRVWAVWHPSGGTSRSDPANEVTMRLMQGPADGALAMPHDSSVYFDPAFQRLTAYPQLPWDFVPDALAFSRLVLASGAYLTQELGLNVESLQTARRESEGLGDTVASEVIHLCIDDVTAQIHSLQKGTAEDAQQALGHSESRLRQFVAHATEATAAAEGRPINTEDTDNRFFQADDGQHIYLHPLDWRVVQHEYQTIRRTALPGELSITVEHREETTMTEDLRKRCRYLAHIPLGCDLVFVQIDLRALVSDACYAHFRPTLEGRVQRRIDKSRRELADQRRREAREATRTGERRHVVPDFSPADFPVGPTHRSPDFAPQPGTGDQRCPTLSGTSSLSSSPRDSESARSLAKPVTGSSATRSFAAAAATAAAMQENAAPANYQYAENDFPSMSALRPNGGRSGLINARVGANVPPADYLDDDSLHKAHSQLRRGFQNLNLTVDRGESADFDIHRPYESNSEEVKANSAADLEAEVDTDHHRYYVGGAPFSEDEADDDATEYAYEYDYDDFLGDSAAEFESRLDFVAGGGGGYADGARRNLQKPGTQTMAGNGGSGGGAWRKSSSNTSLASLQKKASRGINLGAATTPPAQPAGRKGKKARGQVLFSNTGSHRA